MGEVSRRRNVQLPILSRETALFLVRHIGDVKLTYSQIIPGAQKVHLNGMFFLRNDVFCMYFYIVCCHLA